jgi:chromosome segregation ATPase
MLRPLALSRRSPGAVEAESPARPIAPAGELQERVEALTAALDAQERLRLAERAELSRARRGLDALQLRVEAAAAASRAASAEASRLRMARATTDEENHRLRRELAWRAAREAELEQVVRGHLEMQALLSSALETAEATRDAAIAECRLADRNLGLMRSQLALAESPGSKTP